MKLSSRVRWVIVVTYFALVFVAIWVDWLRRD